MTGTRRWFLRGAGAMLAIPVLPSLLKARAAEAQAMQPLKYFVNYGTPHGGAWGENMNPPTDGANVDTMDYAGRRIRRTALAPTTNNGNTVLSPVLSASASALPPSLVAKMTVLRGLDIPFYIAHHTGGHLGNFAANAAPASSTEDGAVAQRDGARRTIDQIMAWSNTFYPDLTSVRQRALVLTPNVSYNYQNPATQSGAIQVVGPTASTPGELFRSLFPAPPSMRTPVVDRVLENYRRLKNNPRLSAADKTRLDDHLQRVSELQRRLGTMVACTYPAVPPSPYNRANIGTVIFNSPFAADPALQAGWFKVMNDLVVAAFSCGLSRVASAIVEPTMVAGYGYNDWHQGVAHRATEVDGQRQGVIASSYRTFFQEVLLDLVNKLEAVRTPSGGTMLDESLVAWTQESGILTHDFRDSTVVAFGSAGGFLRTGQMCDYRNLTRPFNATATRLVQYPGLLWHQWLGTVLQAMGIPKSEYEDPSVTGGYPNYRFANVQYASAPTAVMYPEALWSAASDVLPYLAA